MKSILLGQKIGMSQIYDKNNNLIPITVIEGGPCFITNIICNKESKYISIQISFLYQKKHRLSKSKLGIFKKLSIFFKKSFISSNLTIFGPSDGALSGSL